MSRRHVWIACVMAIAVLLGVFLLRPGDEDQIRKTLDRFLHALTIKDQDNVVARVGRLRSELREAASDDIAVTVPDLNVQLVGRPALVERATAAQSLYQSASAEFTRLTIKIDDARKSARVDGVVVVTGVRGGQRKIDTRDVHLLLRNDGGWRITSLDVMPEGEAR